MPQIIFVDSKGQKRPVDAAVGATVMEAAIKQRHSGHRRRMRRRLRLRHLPRLCR
jgi:hypothetical protein